VLYDHLSEARQDFLMPVQVTFVEFTSDVSDVIWVRVLGDKTILDEDVGIFGEEIDIVRKFIISKIVRRAALS